jgi:hypothetical protein
VGLCVCGECFASRLACSYNLRGPIAGEPDRPCAQAACASRALLSREGITLPHIPTREPLLKPLHALLR